MKVCTVEHDAPGFGTIPEGSIWEDDSEYVTKKTAKFFAAVVEDVPESAE